MAPATASRFAYDRYQGAVAVCLIAMLAVVACHAALPTAYAQNAGEGAGPG
eukprot:CAMPEP_0173426074 /NCGR_PEP_ID=MMETSP1357-20121228/5633_1 /TAXON_ID=77926 /ORGANISM="Hemiselmis rufescens, Strain PCC563" /LENGTH=50 /DNA_ID=CAMNT_0014389653 /DNA_START=142 /DNA_END=290 /DNA_ORIENTATION=+